MLLVILIVSCSDNHSRDKRNSSIDSSARIEKDSITSVDIFYYPSFTNSSVLRLNRITGEGVFIVDTRISFNYGKPDTLKFLLSDMELKAGIGSFWNSSFIHSIRQDTSMLGWTDGMPVWVMFVNNDTRDSVYLGNVYPPKVESILKSQIDYLKKISTTQPMKAYLKQVEEYF